VALCTEQGFPVWWACGTILQGWALAAQGQSRDGLAQLRQGLAAWQATGAGAETPYFLALLAEAHGKGGQPDQGLPVVAEALGMADRNAERFYEAELYRLQGELTLQKVHVAGDTCHVGTLPPVAPSLQAEAEAYFQQALAMARHQQAKSLELRAAMSLSRLWQQQGKRAEAYELLAPIYGWFTEGFDTADLQEAKTLLDVLA
jgi:predicted ATPase